jgi:hypothetical protein
LFALAFLLLCSAAHADLFRWVDPATGSVRFSNSPPPWYDTGSGPPVERVPAQGMSAPPPAAAPEDSAPASVTQLRARWRELLVAVAAQPTQENARAFAQVAAELDRLDPGGANRRQDEAAAALRGARR